MAALYALTIVLVHGLHGGHDESSDEHSRPTACCEGTGIHRTPHTSDCDLGTHPDACLACQVLAHAGIEAPRTEWLPAPSSGRVDSTIARLERSISLITISNRGPPRV